MSVFEVFGRVIGEIVDLMQIGGSQMMEKAVFRIDVTLLQNLWLNQPGSALSGVKALRAEYSNHP